MKFDITGFSYAKGNSKTTGKPYEMARLFRLTEIRAWKNDHGECVVNGFHTDERNAFDVHSDQKLLKDLQLVTFPCQLDLTFEPSPEDPTRNVVTAFTVVSDKSDKF